MVRAAEWRAFVFVFVCVCERERESEFVCEGECVREEVYACV